MIHYFRPCRKRRVGVGGVRAVHRSPRSPSPGSPPRARSKVNNQTLLSVLLRSLSASLIAYVASLSRCLSSSSSLVSVSRNTATLTGMLLFDDVWLKDDRPTPRRPEPDPRPILPMWVEGVRSSLRVPEMPVRVPRSSYEVVGITWLAS